MKGTGLMKLAWTGAARASAIPSLRRMGRGTLGALGLLEQFRRSRNRYDFWASTRFFRQFIKRGNLCFDIGANIGDVCEVMLKLGAKVVAVEPQRENVEVLQSRFGSSPGVVLVPKAAGAAKGFADLMVCRASDCSSMSPEFVQAITSSGRLQGEAYIWNELQTVEITTIDELAGEYGAPAFIKIDVEGFEPEVLKGCSYKPSALSFEFTPERLGPALACIELVEKLGQAAFNYTTGRGKHFELPQWVSGRELAQDLTNRKFQIAVGPGGDVYARFLRPAEGTECSVTH